MVRTVYLAGWGRSGSTVVGAVLGELPGWVSIGELRHLFEPGVTCGCGEPAEACPFWQAVVERARAGLGSLDADRFRREQAEELAPRRVPRVLRLGRAAAPYVARVSAALLAGAAAEAGAEVVVDGSKHPANAALAAWQPATVLVHLLRDPRASAYSWHHRRRPGQQALGPVEATGRWVEWNALTEMVGRRMHAGRAFRLRYEDFVEDPTASLAPIVAASDPAVPEDLVAKLVTGGVAHLGPNHVLCGNPSKFRTGEVPLVRDDGWRKGTGRAERSLIAAATSPLMLRYGYLGIR